MELICELRRQLAAAGLEPAADVPSQTFHIAETSPKHDPSILREHHAAPSG